MTDRIGVTRSSPAMQPATERIADTVITVAQAPGIFFLSPAPTILAIMTDTPLPMPMDIELMISTIAMQAVSAEMPCSPKRFPTHRLSTML